MLLISGGDPWQLTVHQARPWWRIQRLHLHIAHEIIIAIVQLAIEVARPWRLEREEEERRRIKREEERRVFEERCERFEATFSAWKEHLQRRRFVELLETELVNFSRRSR